jgi:hypothetical protein
MPITDDSLELILVGLEKLEGRTSYIYNDSANPPNRTVGVGCMLPDANAACRLPFRNVGAARPATSAEIVADFLRVKAMPGGLPCQHYRATAGAPVIELGDAGATGMPQPRSLTCRPLGLCAIPGEPTSSWLPAKSRPARALPSPERRTALVVRSAPFPLWWQLSRAIPRNDDRRGESTALGAAAGAVDGVAARAPHAAVDDRPTGTRHAAATAVRAARGSDSAAVPAGHTDRHPRRASAIGAGVEAHTAVAIAVRLARFRCARCRDPDGELAHLIDGTGDPRTAHGRAAVAVGAAGGRHAAQVVLAGVALGTQHGNAPVRVRPARAGLAARVCGTGITIGALDWGATVRVSSGAGWRARRPGGASEAVGARLQLAMAARGTALAGRTRGTGASGDAIVFEQTATRVWLRDAHLAGATVAVGRARARRACARDRARNGSAAAGVRCR